MAPPNLALQDDEPEDEAWLTTYSDAVTLLMSFFILLVSFSKIDLPVFDEVMHGLQKEMGAAPKKETVKELKNDVQDVVSEMQADRAVTVGQDDRGVIMELDANAFFEPGGAALRKEAVPFLQRIAQIVKAEQYRLFSVEVEGHTDDDPINTPKFPSNWELSAGRSSSVVRIMGEQGVEWQRMKATGFAETRPKLPNRSRAGVPVAENQAANRRVDVRLSRMSKAERGWFLRQVDPEAYVAEDAAKGEPPAGGSVGQAPEAAAPAASPTPAAKPAAQAPAAAPAPTPPAAAKPAPAAPPQPGQKPAGAAPAR